MRIRTYFDKSNTIVKNSIVNTGLNPVTELFYGGAGNQNAYSRFIFHFDETRLKDLYCDNTFADLTKLTHTLRLTNTGSFDTSLLNGTMGGKDRTSSFDLIVFKVNADWDNGTGYDYEDPDIILVNGELHYSYCPSNWIQPTEIMTSWPNGSGIYPDSASGITIGMQHFDKGNENIEIDITDYVNGLLTGDTNYGLGIAFARYHELIKTPRKRYVGFFTNNTQTFYEPYVETYYSNHIKDDRVDFYLDKPNKLYLYVNLFGQPTNLDVLPMVGVYDQDGNLFSAYTQSAVTQVTKGIYSIDIMVPTTPTNDCTMYCDVWSGIMINGVSRPDIALNFAMKNSMGYYNIGGVNPNPKKVNVTISGIQNNEMIKRGDIKKVFVTPKIPYTVNQTQVIDNIKYRIYTLEGSNQLTTMDDTPLEMTNPTPYFLLDTMSLLSGTYYIDISVESNLELITFKNVCKFSIINQVELRKGQ